VSQSAAVYKIGPKGRPMRPFVMPSSFGGKLRVWRYLILRRVSQFTILALFFGTFHYGWTLFGQPVLRGNLSASEFAGVIPMADPFATLQIFLTQHVLETRVLIGAGIILLLYGFLGGRTFCSWVCPVNMITDGANWLRTRFGLKNVFVLSRGTRYIVLAMALILSVLTGVAAFEWISPIGMFHREVIYGIGLGWMALLGIFLFDLVILRDGWCGHLCPLGGFYALLGNRTAQLRVRIDAAGCTNCGECAAVCPEPQVLNLKRLEAKGFVASGECTNCGRCTPVCPENVLSFDWRWRIPRASTTDSPPTVSQLRRTS
jgi:ferredoxin-type protein NapH